jgi:hypothetical protein
MPALDNRSCREKVTQRPVLLRSDAEPLAEPRGPEAQAADPSHYLSGVTLLLSLHSTLVTEQPYFFFFFYIPVIPRKSQSISLPAFETVCLLRKRCFPAFSAYKTSSYTYPACHGSISRNSAGGKVCSRICAVPNHVFLSSHLI